MPSAFLETKFASVNAARTSFPTARWPWKRVLLPGCDAAGGASCWWLRAVPFALLSAAAAEAGAGPGAVVVTAAAGAAAGAGTDNVCSGGNFRSMPLTAFAASPTGSNHSRTVARGALCSLPSTTSKKFT
eukprot:scaffold1790_cov73-Phaeocystis_antarctica.AAC.5